MLDDQRETSEILDEIGNSEGQRVLDEMVFGEAAFIDQNERRPLPSQPHSLLGSPYRAGYGGHVYAFFYYAVGVLVLVVVATVIHTCASLTAPSTAASPAPAPPGTMRAPATGGP